MPATEAAQSRTDQSATDWMAGILSLEDAPFVSAWFELGEHERDYIGTPGADRFRMLLGRMGYRNGHNGYGEEQDQGQGHDPAEPPPYDEEAPQGPIWTRQPLDWPALAGKEPSPRQWAVKGWLGMGHVTLLVGPGGIGKSLLAQQLGSSIALAHGFIDEIPQQRKVLMWACEDDHDEIWRRQLQIAQWMRVPLGDYAPHLIIEPRHGRPNTMVQSEFGRPALTAVVDELAAQARDTEAEVVIVDNAAQVYGGNENDRHAVTMFLNALCGRMPGKAILLLAHPSRAAGSEFSGSSAWENTARTRLYLGATLPDQPKAENAETNEEVRYLARRKANYSDKDYRKLLFMNGVLRSDPAAGGITEKIEEQKGARVVVRALRKLAELGVRTTDGKTSSEYLPRVIVDYRLNEGLSRLELGRAMRGAMLEGLITRGVVGRYSTRAKKEGLVVVEPAQT